MSVIYNLLDNALKYSPQNPEIEINLKEASEGVELEVRDNGLGISEEYQNKIFEKFFRVPTGNAHNIKGHGLGLSYVASVIRKHEGDISLKSAIGEGSRFIIQLPR
jgi:signal transduction histidine kinase